MPTHDSVRNPRLQSGRIKAKSGTHGVVDECSPDGLRVIMSAKDWKEERFKTAQSANYRCQGCEKPHPVPFNEYATCHHRLGRGGGRRDDRLWKPMFRDSETNIARWRWFRNLLLTCQIGHELLERKSTKEFKHSLMQFCECGLLRLS
jgi:hypothetical protein